MSLKDRGKRVWASALLRGIHYGDHHGRLDMLYRVNDPWELDCERERFRFSATNEIVLREFGKVDALLEVGCGEGLQSSVLSKACARLHGIDVSAAAVERARVRCPDARFTVEDIMERRTICTSEKVDLVVACEVLYYVKAIPEFLNRLSEIGGSCLVTYHGPHRERLEPAIAKDREVHSEIIQYGSTDWVASWWSN